MDFGLSEEQGLLQDTVAQFVSQECDANRLRELFDGDTGFDPALWKGMAELGLAGLLVPEEHGGAGLGILDAALVAETIGRAATPSPFTFHSLAVLAIELGGSDAQKKSWLPKLAAGDALGTVALSDGDGAWQPEEWTLAPGDALTGRKPFVPFGSHAQLIVVGTQGSGLALVEGGASGVRTEPYEGVDRTRRMDTLILEGAPAEALPVAGAAERLRDAALVLLAADAFGGASRCVEMAVEYAKTREQFGVPIGNFQALKHQLANMALDVEPARALYWYAAHALDEREEDAPRMAALAKAHLSDRFMAVARDTVEAHGGIGYTWECDVQIWFKRAMLDRAFLGTPAVHRERSVALAGW